MPLLLDSLETAPSHDVETEESLLVARLRAHDEDAFEEVVHVFGPRMKATALRYLKSDAASQDAVQQAFLSAFTSIDRFRSRSGLGTWLHRITVNHCLMQLRSRRRRPCVSMEEILPHFESGRTLGSEWTDPSEGIGVKSDREYVCRVVRAAVDRLPEKYRSVVILRDFEQFDTDKTADLLGVRPGVVKTRLHRARLSLRKMLGDVYSSLQA